MIRAPRIESKRNEAKTNTQNQSPPPTTNPPILTPTTHTQTNSGVYATLQQRLLFAGQTQALASLMTEAQTSSSNQPPPSTIPPSSSPTRNKAAALQSQQQGGGSSSTSTSSTFPYHDTNACNLVLTDLSKRRRFDLAYTFLSLMHELGLRADTVSYNILMDLALKVRTRIVVYM